MRRCGYVKINGYKKRATAAVLTVALLFCLLVPPSPVTATEVRTESALARLRSGLTASEAVIDLSAYGLTSAALGRLYTALLQDDPALFHVAPRLSYASGGAHDDTVTAVYPVYTLSGGALTEARAYYRASIAALLSEVDACFVGHPRTEAEVALALHDLLAERYEYDVEALWAGGGSTDAYSLFWKGVGVCQAYAMAALAVLREAGLEAHLVTSGAMDHAWVHVRVGGAWYHMDVTRDDPVVVLPDGTAVSAGEVTHTHVLRSDSGMYAMGYHGFSCAYGHACSDGRYETSVAMMALSRLSSPLRAVSVAEGKALVWVAPTADGTLLACVLSSVGITVHAEGDIDGDGAVTPADLLYLSRSALPEAWQDMMRKHLTGDG